MSPIEPKPGEESTLTHMSEAGHPSLPTTFPDQLPSTPPHLSTRFPHDPLHDSAVDQEEILPRAVGRFWLLELLGEGAMGQVYRVFDPTLDREVAVKFIQPRRAAFKEERANFIREARAMAKINHDNVIAVHQVDEVNGVPFIVMPYLQGETLEAYLRRNPQPEIPIILQVAKETAAGLHAAHVCGQIHRDIKPSNIWLERLSPEDFRVKILDFGLARDQREAGSTGGVVGTPVYMSPEQAGNEAVDARADLFSLGVMLYQMATRRLVFMRATKMATLMAVRNDPVPPINSIDPQFPVRLAELIEQMLAKNREARPGTASTVYRKIRELEGDPSSQHRSSAIIELPSEHGGLPGWLLPLGIFCLLVSTITLLVFRDYRNRPKREPIPDPFIAQAFRSDLDDQVESTPTEGELLTVFPREARFHAEVVFRSTSREKRDTPMPITDQTRMPLRTGDFIEIEGRADRPIYWYAVYLDAGGSATLMHPGLLNDWWELELSTPGRSDSFVITKKNPENTNPGVPLTAGESGAEAVLILGRDEAFALEEVQLLKQALLQRPKDGPALDKCQFLQLNPSLQGNSKSDWQRWLESNFSIFGARIHGVVFPFDGRPYQK
jgi:serine/threonine protein kinase